MIGGESPLQSRQSQEQQLGIDLLVKIARIEESSFKELQSAIAEESEGLVNGLIQEMNTSIARHLNVSRWWSQDPEFQLRVSPREHELVFTIRDRTGTDYSFTERSRGLRYFISYYVQLLAHDRPESQPEVLLMDEPDAYLSASGQQDPLRILEHCAPGRRRPRSEYCRICWHAGVIVRSDVDFHRRPATTTCASPRNRAVRSAPTGMRLTVG